VDGYGWDYQDPEGGIQMSTKTGYRACTLCGCSKDVHPRFGPCLGKDEEGYDCTCDYYESEPTSNAPYCDSCLTVAYDHVGNGRAEQVQFLEVLGADIDDHDCDSINEPDHGPCSCAAHTSR
jgi:hypothetical protein